MSELSGMKRMRIQRQKSHTCNYTAYNYNYIAKNGRSLVNNEFKLWDGNFRGIIEASLRNLFQVTDKNSKM
jgi:hypothetical protein